MSRASARACANLAFVKYWGKRDAALNLPTNSSISMTLDAAHTTTCVEIDPGLEKDEVWMSGEPAPGAFASRVIAHLERIRSLAGSATPARVHTSNNFPAGTGFASSASGFAALTCAASAALGLRLSRRDLSVLARKGSGSSCRSIHAGFVEWHAGQDDHSSFATQLADARHWNLVDLAVLVTEREKSVRSSDGHRLAANSPFWPSRTRSMASRLAEVRQALLKRDFHRFGREVETEALEMHAIMQTSAHEQRGAWQSGIFYMAADTLRLINAVQRWRQAGMEVYFTLDAGPTVHLLCLEDQSGDVLDAVQSLEGSQDWRTIACRPGPGAKLLSEIDAT
ncbi:MAG: diphosphomevalonate decarboxylase [Anaerolineaceae bacterium]|nr:diphosphomevalonate decarboxylase [Anaerolineaceae bacterium]